MQELNNNIGYACTFSQVAIYDTWFQTETGAIMIANRPDLELRPGSMGKPVGGIEAAILDDAGSPLPDGEQATYVSRPVGRPCFAPT